MPSAAQWQQRFELQARWTAQVRRLLLDGLGLAGARRGLEVGCGTGAVLAEMSRLGPAALMGIDLRADFLQMARSTNPSFRLAQGDALQMPFASAQFDFTYCHYFLLWVANPLDALREMRRVTRPGSPVFALAEPDYGGRIDYPPALAKVGQQQTSALRAQGADPEIGRALADLFNQAGFKNVRAALIAGQWGETQPREALESEWETLESDLAGCATGAELSAYRRQDALAWQTGVRILFIPTFYAWGFA
jgi:ubiquinone/menaquinone biosynthesis C-methylase UbiE